MKGLITRAAAALGCAAALAGASGCIETLHPRYLWDPCWPQRYNYQARMEVLEGFGAQVNNGHVLDQTVWNWHFVPGSDELTPGGLEHLAYLARRRPCPDPVVYLQTAQDIAYDPAAPEKYVETRCDLNARRAAAIQKFLTAYSAGRHIHWDVVVHDPADVGIAAVPMGLAIQGMYTGSRGTLPGAAGAGAGATVTGGR